jgi:hypothetical protein
MSFADLKGSTSQSALSEASDRPLWCRPREATRLADVGMTTLYQWIKDGTVVSRRVGNIRLISIDSIKRLGLSAGSAHGPAE